MTRRIPIFATLLVLAAAGIMIGLGFWQLGRLAEKEALLSRYGVAQGLRVDASWPETKEAAQLALYRRSRVTCAKVSGRSSMAGRNVAGEAGVAQVVDCVLADGSSARVVLGWSRNPQAGTPWSGGEVRGTIAPGPRLVADPPLAGLEANERPDPASIPNNHFAYAVQWFLFAITALVVYGVALRRRLKS